MRIVNGTLRQGEIIYRDWKEIEPTFTPQTEPVWVDTHVVDEAFDWSEKNTGVVWGEFGALEDAMIQRFGAERVFARQGRNAKGDCLIDNESGKHSIYASIRSNGTGRNLQMFDRALVLVPPGTADGWEQLLGRHHREGQKSDEVAVDVFLGSSVARSAWDRARMQAQYGYATTSQEHRILYADLGEGLGEEQ